MPSTAVMIGDNVRNKVDHTIGEVIALDGNVPEGVLVTFRGDDGAVYSCLDTDLEWLDMDTGELKEIVTQEDLELSESVIQDGLEFIKEDEAQEFCCPFCDALLPYEGASCRGCDNPAGNRMTDPRGD